MKGGPITSTTFLELEIEALGTIKRKIKELQAEEKILADKVKKSMEVGDIITTPNFTGELSESNNRVLDQTLIRKKIGQKKFLEVAEVSIKVAETLMGKEDLDSCVAEYVPVQKLLITPKKK